MANKWEPGASFFVMWFENIAVVVADVKKVFALSVQGNNGGEKSKVVNYQGVSFYQRQG